MVPGMLMKAALRLKEVLFLRQLHQVHSYRRPRRPLKQQQGYAVQCVMTSIVLLTIMSCCRLSKEAPYLNLCVCLHRGSASSRDAGDGA